MDKFLVIAKTDAKTDEDWRIINETDPVPEGYRPVFGPLALENCVEYIKDQAARQPNWYALTIFQYALIAVVTVIFVVVVGIGAGRLYNSELRTSLEVISTADDAARILITFLVAVATVGIAFLAVLTAMVIREYKERFALAKEVLTILVGILGTIVGFYFGVANTAGKPAANAPAVAGSPAAGARTPENANLAANANANGGGSNAVR